MEIIIGVMYGFVLLYLLVALGNGVYFVIHQLHKMLDRLFS